MHRQPGAGPDSRTRQLNEGPHSLHTHRLLVRREKRNPYSSRQNWFSVTHSRKHSCPKYRISEKHQVTMTATVTEYYCAPSTV